MTYKIKLSNCQWWFLLPLAFFFFSASSNTRAQGTIVYVKLPATLPIVFPYDANGLRLAGGFPMSYDLMFNGQLAFTLTSGTEFTIHPSPLSTVLALIPTPNDLGGFVIPLQYGQEIGPGAAGYEWINDGVGSGIVSCRDIGCIGYFVGLESGYAGLQFQQGGQTYYGWVRVGAPVIGINGGWIYDYAYSTIPNTPIFAGQVPEPSSGILTVLGGLSFWMFRRSRSVK